MGMTLSRARVCERRPLPLRHQLDTKMIQQELVIQEGVSTMNYRTSFNEMWAKLGKNDMVRVRRRKAVLAVSCEIREGCTQKVASEGLPGAGKLEGQFPTDGTVGVLIT